MLKRIAYQAFDGTLFDSEEKCREYEDKNLKLDISCSQHLYDVFATSIINLIIGNIPEYIKTHYNLPIQYWDNGWKLSKYMHSNIKQIKINNIKLISDAFIVRLDFVLEDGNVIKEAEMSVAPETIEEAFNIISNMLNQAEKKYESYYD